jgi:Glycosyltransferases involved in cell wall biogenesis
MNSSAGLKFSVITVTRNDLLGLRETIDSVLSQNGINYEHIVVDGASSDGTVAYLSTIHRGGFKWISEPDSGIYDAMNKSLRLVDGDYIVFLNAGDSFSRDDALEKVQSCILHNSSPPDVVYCGAQYVMKNSRTHYRRPRTPKSTIWHGLPANHQSTFYRYNVFPGYDVSYRICGDYYIASILQKKGACTLVCDYCVVKFRIGDTSYKRPFVLMSEAFAIQRDVLSLPIYLRFISGGRRLFSIVAVRILSTI